MENVLLNLPLICTFVCPTSSLLDPPNHIPLVVSGFFVCFPFFFRSIFYFVVFLLLCSPSQSPTHFLLTFSTCTTKLVNIVILVKKELLSSFFYAFPSFFLGFLVAGCCEENFYNATESGYEKNVEKCQMLKNITTVLRCWKF